MHLCPICGYNKLEFPPEDFTICPSCGTEFGYQDATIPHNVLRQMWIAGGMKWHSKVIAKPVFWNPDLQLLIAKIPFESPWAKDARIEVKETVTAKKTVSLLDAGPNFNLPRMELKVA